MSSAGIVQSDSMPEELRERVPHDPRLWVRNFLRHPEDPTRAYDFYTAGGPEDGEFLYYLVDEEGPMLPQNWGDINVLLFARGSLKTFTCTAIMSWACDVFPTMEVDATAPVDDQRYEVIDRFKEKAEQAGMTQRREKDKLSHQKFKQRTVDEDGNEYTSYSHVKSRSAWGEGNKLRGLHGHIGVIDESQDVDEGTFSTFATEAVDREVPQVPYFPTVFVIGTPKMTNSFFDRLWQMSDQKTWSQEDKEWTSQQDAAEFLPQELKDQRAQLRERAEEVEERGEHDLAEQLRAEADEIEGFTVRGWHVDQPNSPLHSAKEIAFKRETYSKRKFQNEVLAKFYTPENDLITNDDVWAALDDEEDFRVSQRYEDTPTYLGVDWGGGDGEGAARTVCVVGEMAPDGETMEILNVDVFSSDLSAAEEREQIAEYMDQYDVDIGVVDEGHGDTDREELQDSYGFNDRSDSAIYGCWYGNVKDKEEIKWNRFKDSKRYFTTAKTFMCKSFAEDFKDRTFRIPSGSLNFDTKNDLGTQIIEELTATYTDRTETASGRTTTRVESDRSDDIFDAFTYLWIAANKVQSTRTLRSMGSVNRAPRR